MDETGSRELEAAYVSILEDVRSRCEADGAGLLEVEGEALVNRAFRERFEDGEEESGFPNVPFRLIARGDRGTFAPVTVVLEQRVVHLPDLVALAALPDYDGHDPAWIDRVIRGTCRTWLGPPLLKDGRAVGTLWASQIGGDARPFTAAQIATLQEVAAEAVVTLGATRRRRTARRQAHAAS